MRRSPRTWWTASLALAVVITPVPANADVVTKLYVDTPFSVVWDFVWDGGNNPGNFRPPITNPLLTRSWEVSATFRDTEGLGAFDDLTINAVHTTGPHTGIDMDPGGTFTYNKEDADRLPRTTDENGVTANVFYELADTYLTHPSKADDTLPKPMSFDVHRDHYLLLYNKPNAVGGSIEFVLIGDHEVVTVPEPSPLALGGLFTIVALVWASCRHRSR